MSKANLELGKSGEEEALRLLAQNGYRILARNYSSKLGEIDIVALDRDTVCFVEVKSRRSVRFGLAQESVGPRKQRQIGKAALAYLKEKKMLNRKARFDVVSVMCSESGARADLLKDAFELDSDFTY